MSCASVLPGARVKGNLSCGAVLQVAEVGHELCFAGGQAVGVDEVIGGDAFGVEFCGSAEF